MPGVSHDLQKLASDAGVDELVVKYLAAKKVFCLGILGSLAKDFDEVDLLLYNPLAAGLEIEGVTYQTNPDQAAVTKAALRFLWKTSYDMLLRPATVLVHTIHTRRNHEDDSAHKNPRRHSEHSRPAL